MIPKSFRGPTSLTDIPVIFTQAERGPAQPKGDGSLVFIFFFFFKYLFWFGLFYSNGGHLATETNNIKQNQKELDKA